MGWQCVPTALVEYERWRPELASLLDTRFHTIEWLDGQILSGKMQLFSDEQSAIVTAVKAYPTGAKECQIMAATGELDHLTGPAILRVEQWAAKQGCIVVTIQSRSGWKKIMKSKGYEPHQTCIRKGI